MAVETGKNELQREEPARKGKIKQTLPPLSQTAEASQSLLNEFEPDYERRLKTYLNGLLSRFEISTSRLCRLLLETCLEQDIRRDNQKSYLSCTGVFLTVASITGMMQSNGFIPHRSGDEIARISEESSDPDHSEYQIIQNVSAYLQEDRKLLEEWKKLYGIYFGEKSGKVETSPFWNSTPLPTDGFLDALKSLKGTQNLRMPNLLTALIRSESGSLRRHLIRHELDSESILDILSSQTDGKQLFQGLRLNRDPEEDLEQSETLGINSTSAAIATILRTAQGEFCFGLFGAWGSGKTFLAKRLGLIMENPSDYGALMQRLGVHVEDDPEFSQRYEIVFHSAWKYPRVPEAWAYLYEALADRFMDCSTWERLGRTLRAQVWKQGIWPMLFLLLAAALAAQTVSTYTGAIAALTGAGGLAGLGFLIRGLQKSQPALMKVAKRFFTLARHSENLGLQAMIGDDLKALMAGWMPNPGFSRKRRFIWKRGQVPWLGFPFPLLALESQIVSHGNSHIFSGRKSLRPAILVVAFATALWLGPLFFNHGSGVIFTKEGMQQLEDSLKSMDLVWHGDTGLDKNMPPVQFYWEFQAERLTSPEFLIFLLWLSCCSLLFWILRGPARAPDRVLLVIDDLDRCSASEMLDLIEALKLLLEDPEIHKRLQIMMLVDEEHLDHAIVHKFSSVEKDENADRNNRNYLIREHKEKLFTSHLRLQPLNEQAVIDITAFYTRPTNTAPSIAIRPPVSKHIDIKAKGNAEPIRQHQPENGATAGPDSIGIPDNTDDASGQPPTSLPTPVRFSTNDLRFNDVEIQHLKSQIILMTQKDPNRANPRAIRLTMFKYQLCRSLLQLSETPQGRAFLEQENAVKIILSFVCLGAIGEDLTKIENIPKCISTAVEQVT